MASAYKRGYTKRWEKARKTYLQRNPLCAYCKQTGRTTAATVVDHITPHKGDSILFWDTSNWQPLCKQCHDGTKQAEERTGRRRGASINGLPLDKEHHWYV